MVTAYSDKPGAAPTFKYGFGFHQTQQCGQASAPASASRH